MSEELKRYIKLIEDQEKTLQADYNIEKIGIFGSFARAEERQESDLDILVEFSRPIGLFKFIDLEEYLSKILNKKVDLVSRKALKPAIKERVLKETIYV